jgi:hypothetical protein
LFWCKARDLEPAVHAISRCAKDINRRCCAHMFDTAITIHHAQQDFG